MRQYRSISRWPSTATKTLARIALVCAPWLILAAMARTQSPSAADELKSLQEQLRNAHAHGDANAYLNGAQRMRDFLNGSPTSILQRMSAEAFAGQPEKALRSLTEFVHMGQSNEAVLKREQFNAMRNLPAYPKLHQEMVANTASVAVASRMFAFPREAEIPEDVDFDPSAKLFYLSSAASKEIFTIDRNGRAKVFAEAPDHWPMMALKVDARRRRLWATEVAIDGFRWSPKEEWGQSAVLLYDLQSAKLLRRIEGPAHTALGDMTLTADGDAIISDGDHGGIYKVAHADGKIARLDAGDFISPQTSALSDDGRHLFVPDYLRGIGSLDMKTHHTTWIAMEGKYALNGIDGLYRNGRSLIATQNGVSPERVIRFELDPSLSRVISESIIERATATLGDPTHGVIVGRDFYYIANSGWDTLDEHGNRKSDASKTVLMCARLY
jgi:hypothetical protein